MNQDQPKPTTVERLIRQLWPEGKSDPDQQVYWLLDGARDAEITQLVRYGDLKFWCLYSGELTPRLRAAAPYLVQLDPASPSTLRLLESAWGRACGILAIAPATLEMAKVRLHFKKFLRVQTEDGTRLVFRFYDPRVLSVFVPSCTQDQLVKFFGPLKSLVVEMDEGERWQMFAAP